MDVSLAIGSHHFHVAFAWFYDRAESIDREQAVIDPKPRSAWKILCTVGVSHDPGLAASRKV